MKRLLCVLALAAVVLIPDWASACWNRWGRPVYHRPYYTPVCYTPTYYVAPPVYCQPVYIQPAYVVPHNPMTPPRIVPSNDKSDSARPKPPSIARPEPAPPAAEPVRPAANVEPPKPPKSEPEPQPKRGGLLDIPSTLKPDAKPPAPKIEAPKSDDVKIPPLTLPDVKPDVRPLTPPDAKPNLPSLTLPDAKPALPPVELPNGSPAVPAPAPAPDALIPPPNLPAPKNADALPPLTLPPDTPVAPPKVVEAKSSPLSVAVSKLNVSVFPAAGSATAAGLRKVGFYNHTKRDLTLTIEDKTVTLPAMSYLHAQLPPSFSWKCADKPLAKQTVPADATGLDVLIRE